MSRNGRVLKPPRTAGPSVVRRRFATLLGKRRTLEILPLLTQVHAAYRGLKRSAKAIRGRGANVFTQWVGDPDALGSAVLLTAILRKLGAEEVRILTGSLGHPQNRNLVARCGITLLDPNKDRLRRGLHCMVDTSPPLGMLATTGVQPVKDYFFVADHHADPAEVEENCRARGVRRVRLPFVGLHVGSTSAFMAVLAELFDVLEELTPAERAAAALGIYTDTSALLHGATPLDFKMFEVLTRDGGDAGHPRRAARLPRAAGVERLPRRRVPQPGGDGRRARRPRRLRARRAPRRDRRDRDRAAAGRADLDRDRDRRHRARRRGVRAGRQPSARGRPGAHRAGDRLPARGGVPRSLGLPPRPPAAAPRRGRRVRTAHEGAALRVGPRRRVGAGGRERPDPRVLPGAGAPAGGGAARPEAAAGGRWTVCCGRQDRETDESAAESRSHGDTVVVGLRDSVANRPF